MSKLNLRIKLDQDFEVDLNNFDFDGMDEFQIKRELIQWYFAEIGRGEVELEVEEKKGKNLILQAVKGNQLKNLIEFYEIELERDLTTSEKLELFIWIQNGQK